MAPTLRAKNKNPPERAAQEEDGGSSDSRSSPGLDPAKTRKAPPAEAESPHRKRKWPSAKSPERDRKKPNPLDAKRNAPSAEADAAKKPLPFQRTWTPDDEVRILEALTAHRREHGQLPNSHVLFASLDGRLDKKGIGSKELNDKVRSLRRRHNNDAKKGRAPTKRHERHLYHLSKNVWGDVPKPIDGARAKCGGGQTKKDTQVPNADKTFDEMRELYPYLAHELMVLVDAEAQPTVLEKVLPTIDDSKAQVLDLKIMKLKEELTNTVMESARMQSVEIPKVQDCPSTKFQPAKLGAEHENCFLLGHLNKMDGVSICAQEKLARMENQILELKQIVIASQSSPKMLQRMMPRRRKEKIDAESQILRDVLEPRKVTAHSQKDFPHYGNKEGGKEVVLLSIIWPHVPVAKATLQTSSRSAIVGGMPLGSECCQVFVNDVLKREAPLLRQFGNMKKMADAHKCSIAWPLEQIRHNTPLLPW